MDPYRVLGIDRMATDEQVREAYRELAKKYHPDNYDNSVVEDLAGEKMKELNEAYDSIMDDRRGRGEEQKCENSHSSNQKYPNVRRLIIDGAIIEAEQILNAVPVQARDGEWYFLKGSVCYKKGFLEDSYSNFESACRMDPFNQEYTAAFNRVQGQRSGAFGGYGMNQPRGCTGCDVCTSLMCADCCCECMGGDCIRCC